MNKCIYPFTTDWLDEQFCSQEEYSKGGVCVLFSHSVFKLVNYCLSFYLQAGLKDLHSHCVLVSGIHNHSCGSVYMYTRVGGGCICIFELCLINKHGFIIWIKSILLLWYLSSGLVEITLEVVWERVLGTRET